VYIPLLDWYCSHLWWF